MKKADFGIELTPLIDVVLLLLIFFLLSSSFFMHQKVELAKSSAERGKKEIVVTIDKYGFIYLGKESVSLDALYEKLSEMKEVGTVVIAADKETLHGIVVAVMDRVKGAGFEHLYIATR